MTGAAHGTSAFGSRSASRRFALVPIVAVHAVVLALIAADRGPPHVVPQGSRLIAVDLAAPVAQPDVAPPSARADDPPETLVLPPIVQVAAPTEAILLAPPAPMLADAAPSTVACDLAGQLQTVLRADPAIRSAIVTLPRDARSVANAVMLWDGRWIEGATPRAQGVLQAIKDVVLTTIAQAPTACRAEAVAGPRLVAVAGPPDMVLALGSGRWSWNDLIASSGGRWRMVPTAPVTIASRADATFPGPGT